MEAAERVKKMSEKDRETEEELETAAEEKTDATLGEPSSDETATAQPVAEPEDGADEEATSETDAEEDGAKEAEAKEATSETDTEEDGDQKTSNPILHLAGEVPSGGISCIDHCCKADYGPINCNTQRGGKSNVAPLPAEYMTDESCK